jgi:hypothetical protein
VIGVNPAVRRVTVRRGRRGADVGTSVVVRSCPPWLAKALLCDRREYRVGSGPLAQYAALRLSRHNLGGWTTYSEVCSDTSIRLTMR